MGNDKNPKKLKLKMELNTSLETSYDGTKSELIFSLLLIRIRSWL